MAPDGQRTSRKLPLSSSTVYARKTRRKAETHTNKHDLPRPSHHEKVCSTASESDPPVRTPSSSASRATHSRSSKKLVKPLSKGAQRSSLQQQQRHEQRQAQQKQLQQIRAIRRKRTVAFAVNHERVSQPHSACVVSLESASAPECHNSSSAHSKSTRDTVGLVKNHTLPPNGIKNSTVTRDSISSRASQTIQDSTCTFQQTITPSDLVEDPAAGLKRGKQQQEYAVTAGQSHPGLILESTTHDHVTNDNDHVTKFKNPKHSNSCRSRLVVDIQSAEAAATAIPNNVTNAVPVTPNYLPHSVQECGCTAANEMTQCTTTQDSTTKKHGLGKSASCNQLPASKRSKKEKAKRVRYDMELVPFVEINKKLLRDTTLRSRNLSLSRKTMTSTHRQRDGRIAGKHGMTTENATDSSKAITIPPSDDNCNLLLKGSALWIPSSRQEWEDTVSEMKSVCTSAAFRRWSKKIFAEYENSIINRNSIRTGEGKRTTTSANVVDAKTTTAPFQPPLSQAFIKDRVQIDDPLKGYQVRHATGGWLQGFLIWTNFTVWTLDFQWDSQHPASGLSHNQSKAEGDSIANDDGTLSKELQALPRSDQDPLDGGIVLKQVAEISLLGGLGCGEILLRKAIEDIRHSKTNGDNDYKYVVLQATEGSRGFYEKMGFVRVGAVCRYRWAEYCGTNKAVPVGKSGKKTGLKMSDAINMNPKTTAIEPPPKFYGYRHWTYTNESSKSLDAHGGPSIMMCLKLEEYIQHDNQSVSDLLKPHVVDEKPVIHIFGNVSNPDGENNAPTRKSKRHTLSDVNLGSVKERAIIQREHEIGGHSTQSIEVAGSTEPAITTATPRRSSTRAKRRSMTLANSVYVLYGVKGDLYGAKEDRKSSDEIFSIRTECSKKAPKRRRRNEKLDCNASFDAMEAKNYTLDVTVTTSSVATKIDVDSTINQKGASSEKTKVMSVPSAIMSTSFSASTDDSLKVSIPLQPPTSGKATSENGTRASKIDAASTQDDELLVRNTSERKTRGAARKCHNKHVSFTQEKKSEFSQNPKPTKVRSETRRVSFTESCLANSVPTDELVCLEKNEIVTTTVAAVVGEQSIVVCENSEDVKGSSSVDPIRNQSQPKKQRVVEVKTQKAASIPLACRQRVEQQTKIDNHSQAPIASRKRTRKSTVAIDKSTLLKQKIKEQANSTVGFFNKVVIRRNVAGSLSGSKGQIRWYYNGGLMIDHRCEYCYYFVLDSNEEQKSLTIIPMIKDGVFEEEKGDEKKILDKRVLGRPRFECNILKTDKNWIRDAPMKDYLIVQDAVPVINTPLVAQEAWDIGGFN